jgi:uncharacterized membrane protein YhaH (DUF805 family)
MSTTKLFFSFSGRIGRREYWLGTITMFIVLLVIDWLLGIPQSEPMPTDSHLATAGYVIGTLSLYPTAAIVVKRLHDLSKAAWIFVAVIFAIITLLMNALALSALLGYLEVQRHVSFLDWIAIAISTTGVSCWIALGLTRGTLGPNQYGPDPLIEDT